MDIENSVVLNGYRFTYLSHVISGGTTTMTYEVKGTGETSTPLENWVLQLCPLKPEILANAEVLKCMVQEDDELPLEAACEKIVDGDLPGIRFTEHVGSGQDDPPVKFIINFSGEISDDCVKLGYEEGSTVYLSDDQDVVLVPAQGGYNCEDSLLAVPFTACISIPAGFSVVEDGDIESMVTSQALRAIYERESRPALTLPPHPMMVTNGIVDVVYAAGCVNILVKVPIQTVSREFTASVCGQVMVCVNDAVCCIADGQQVTLDVSVPPTLTVVCPGGTGCESQQQCTISGTLQIRCIETDV